jgi:hypothetical protein
MDKKSGKKIKELNEQQAITEAVLFPIVAVMFVLIPLYFIYNLYSGHTSILLQSA